MYPVSSEAASNDDDAADRKEDDETNALYHGQGETEESRDRESVYHKVGDDVDDGLSDKGWTFGDAVTVSSEQSPVARDWSAVVRNVDNGSRGLPTCTAATRR